MTGRALDDGPRPHTDEVVSLSFNVRRDASAFCVEQDDASETGLFEGVGDDEVHFAGG